MNIKSESAHEMAKELAALEGTSVTAAVTLSLHEALARRRAKTVAESRLMKMREISALFAQRERENPGTKSLWEINEDLYDERGLPQ